MELVVNGRCVTMKDKLPARENWDLISQWRELDPNSFDDMAGMLARFVESWDFPGDPKDVESYAELDLFREFSPLVEAMNQLFRGITEEPGNLPNGSI